MRDKGWDERMDEGTFVYYNVTCTPIAKQRVGKQFPAKTGFW
jgi:hypothetical protein